MTLFIYNTLSKEKEEFQSIEPHKVRMYLCGPTVYDLLHIGNFRGVIFFNLVRNWLERNGYDVRFVLNFTDIDDKIITRAQEEGISTEALTKRYIAAYLEDVQCLHITPHELNPKCTDHIQDMITFITQLIDKKSAYVSEGSVFFDISRFSDYGKLSGKKLEDLIAGHRVDPDPTKKNPLDFVLWKPSKEGEPYWDSPWGKGRPGWHIECSAMNHCIHGDQIDIHGGGIDLIFPHHENEIAQSESLTGKSFSRYWMHNNFIRFGNDKMSKSLGNVIKARDYMTQFHPEILKFLMLSVHYRSELSIDNKQTHQAIGRLSRIYHALKTAQELSQDTQATPLPFIETLNTAEQRISDALNDDFNTPVVFAAFFDVIREFNQLCNQLKKKDPSLKSAAYALSTFIETKGALFSLFQENSDSFLKALDMILVKEKNIDIRHVEALIQQRNDARKNKDFSLSDSIRDKLTDMSILIQDTPNGTVWEMDKYSDSVD
ncbi:cysteine--tRNA ligase [Candidatus Marinamargulisbacteria bacterium SCGC AG-343-D04]|nr:cysteine--tRNA ligase [Candidatus Marinamargulisbacteria bacterium SCGC AG-343-D04]